MEVGVSARPPSVGADESPFLVCTCARANDDEAEPEFDELRNKKTDETVHRDKLRLLEGRRPTEGSA